MSEKNVLVLDDRSGLSLNRILSGLDARTISYTVVANVFEAIRMIPGMNYDGMIIKGFLK